MGVDRRDNTLGHVKGNLDPSCGRCNMIRKAIPRDEFLAFIRDVIRFNDAKRIPNLDCCYN